MKLNDLPCFCVQFKKKSYLCDVKNKKMKKTTWKKAGDWLLDVAKYVATVIVVASFLGEFSEQRVMYYGIGVLVISICFITGLIIIDKTEDKT